MVTVEVLDKGDNAGLERHDDGVDLTGLEKGKDARAAKDEKGSCLSPPFEVKERGRKEVNTPVEGSRGSQSSSGQPGFRAC